MLATCESEPDRAALTALNYPEATHFVGDILEQRGRIITYLEEKTAALGNELFLISCTAPCQGMSKSGQGTLLRNIRLGKRPRLDPRNRLILPALSIISALQPRWAVFENVLEMRNTMIEDEDGEIRPILAIIANRLGPNYVGKAHDVEVADYGVPQRRQRLITVYTRDDLARSRFQAGVSLIPRPTHARAPRGALRKWVSVSEALKHFPTLDAASQATAVDFAKPFHRVPVLDPKKYEWIRNTPAGASAFDNQCINPACLFQGNRAHGSAHDQNGVNRSLKDTPLYCERCGELLPRPYTEESDGSRRIMSGYTSAYKRMSADLPAPTLTRNLSYPCSDHKVHPRENRVLSLQEAMVLQTISDYDYSWGPIAVRRRGEMIQLQDATDGLIRLVIGESVPPKFLHALGGHMKRLSRSTERVEPELVTEEARGQLTFL